MPRRGHKKSRAGCIDCKRRHVKCDETRPSCVNCKVASLQCSYITAPIEPSLAVPSAIATPSSSSRASDADPSGWSKHETNPTSTAPTVIVETVNMDHIELFHHYTSTTYRSFTDGDAFAATYRDACISYALKHPFLMHAILALSAMHLSSLHPDRSERYHSMASSLQSVALSGLNQTLLNINADNCVPVFIFCSVIGLHSFHETFAFREESFNLVLDRFVSCIKLLKGVRLVTDGWWEYMRTTELVELLDSGKSLNSPAVNNELETKPLRDMLAESDLGVASRKVYDQVVTKLQQIFNSESQVQHARGAINMLFAWPVIVSNEYTDFLMQRRPEAMVILAYYGVILHNRHDTWAVGDAGHYLISSISEHLGSHWEQWMTWPKMVVSSTSNRSTMNSPP